MVYAIFLIGLFKLNLGDHLQIICHVVMFPVVSLLAVIKTQENNNTDWIIKPQPNLSCFQLVMYAAFYLYLVFGTNYIEEALWATNILMTALTIYFYVTLQIKWRKWLYR